MKLPAILSAGPRGRLQRTLLLARLALVVERSWQALLRPVILTGLMLLLIASGLLPALPDILRMSIWLAFVITLAWLLQRDLRQLRLPGHTEVLTRVERSSHLPHQPLRTLHDDLATSTDDPATRSLWQAHRARVAAHIRQLRAGWPRSDAPRRDPWALRFALALALIATFALQGNQFPDNLRTSLRLPVMALPQAAPARLDAWIDPPAFTGAPPVMLAVNGKLMHQDEVVRTVQGATLVIRHAGASPPRLTLHALHADNSTGTELQRPQLAKIANDSWQAKLKLTRSVQVQLLGAGVSATWRIGVADDLPPQVKLQAPPTATASGVLMLRWRAEDDHGVRSARAVITLANPVAGMLSFKPPEAPLRIPRPQRIIEGRDTLRLMAHPWAGLPVRLTITASDVAGQEGHSAPVTFTLPQRPFRQPLARAIIEQRRELVLHPTSARDIAEVLAAFLAWPQDLLEEEQLASAYLGLRHAMRQLLQARDEEDLKQVVALLWEIATRIEDGDMAAARRQLEAARKALQEALKNGASAQEIARRVAELKQALQRYMQSLAQHQMQQGTAPPRFSANGQVRLVRPQDLQRMMDQIERMARAGARDAAQRLLSQLDDILNNLQTLPPMAMRPSPEEQALRQLQRLLREQQKLLDETWQQAQRQLRERHEFEPGEKMQQLQRQQQALADTLRQLMEQLQRQPGNGEQAPPQADARQPQDGQQRQPSPQQGTTDGAQSPGNPLSRAERAMKGAASKLGHGQPRTAMGDQMRALQALRSGARNLARRIARQQGRGQGSSLGFMRPRHDPLGRPLRGRFMEPGPDQPMLPNESAMERARRILEQLRRRAEDATRPPLERNYIDRLLRGLY